MKKLVDLAAEYYVKESELWKTSRLLYTSVLADTVADENPNTEDLGRLVQLKQILRLSYKEVATCHQKVDSLGSGPRSFGSCVLVGRTGI